MTTETELLERVRDALRSDTRVRFDDESIVLALSDGALVIDGEVADVSIKRRTSRIAAAVVAPRPIIDRLHVRPAQAMADGMIGDLVRDALVGEPALTDCRLRLWVKGQPEMVSDPPSGRGAIDIRVEDGVVTLDGEVLGLGRKRLAGALAWWVPGSRDVINGLGVVPPEADNDPEITDAVRLVLEKDPFVNPDQVRVASSNAVVTLEGLVPTESERDMAEHDAWYVFGVEDVVNRLAIEP
ncbi:MAG TPA: BON domain-containing protein [Stellaceae bacterium]|nr:BON domain-containing protein [Stellaceae bacterium]